MAAAGDVVVAVAGTVRSTGVSASPDVDDFDLAVNVSGPFWPQPDSSKPIVINAVIASGARALGTRLSNGSDIE